MQKRLRRLEKKERKRAKKNDASDDIDNCESVANSEVGLESRKEIENKEETSVVVKKIQATVIPPALRNRNKKMYRQWIWTFLVVIAVYILFCIGNSDVFIRITADWQILH
ncbi:Cgd8_3850 protein [Striga asiatica]|uniref:Cgd8_3850 protein n=1 Tax=Striga asiatica TaxID=4170 RepID=A0A5A7QUV1_STRAF|nr:Cgd8_3850 protein [Striga asiatica]